jgi:DNA-directed RNA polymerase subunit alpha
VIEMNVEQGVGYAPASGATGLPIGVLPVDAIYSPVRKVNFNVERTRVGQNTDFERLILEVWTNGAISPVDAVQMGAKELVEYFFKVSNVLEVPTEDEGTGPRVHIPASQYNMPVESLNLTARTLNCLKRASIHKVGEILERTRGELLRIRNFGEKSLDELNERLTDINIIHPEFGPVPEGAEGAEGEADVVEGDADDASDAVAEAATDDDQDEEE